MQMKYLTATLIILFIACGANVMAQTATPTITNTPTVTATPTSTPTWSQAFPRDSAASDHNWTIGELFNKAWDERLGGFRTIPIYAINSDGSLIPATY